jgi:hypothetical protein
MVFSSTKGISDLSKEIQEDKTSIQLPLPLSVEAYGDPWKIDKDNPATVPIPNAVIMTKIEGPFTERDRKLWTFLVHAKWDELLTERYHEISVAKVNRVFHELGGEKTASWIWQSALRLAKTIVEWDGEGPDSERLQGVSNLMNAKISKSARENGILWFEIPALLSEVIKQPFRFSRIRLHFMIGLSGKYTVTLYELLESAVNMRRPVMELDIDRLRQWLKVPSGKLPRYVDLKRRILEPALKQINDDPEGAGFTVKMEPIKKGRAVQKIRFTMTKTPKRIEEERRISMAIQPPAAANDAASGPGGFPVPVQLRLETYSKAKEAAPGYDVYALEQDWKEWIDKKGTRPENPDKAFIGFCRRKAKQHPLT